MGLPSSAVTFSPEAVGELSGKLSDCRHNVNNFLSLVVAAGELIRYRPEMAERMAATAAEQSQKITEEMQRFSAEFDKAFGITRP